MKLKIAVPPIVDPKQRVYYSSNLTPSNYACHGCGTTGIKLWREYQTSLDQQSLLCVVCSGKEQKMNINSIDKNGRTDQEFGMTDQIGWRIPAVLTTENTTYWGYCSVPQDGVEWWHRLPAYPLGVRKVKVDDFNNYSPGTPEYVYHHGVAKKKRGKNLSTFLLLGDQKIADPKAAFYLAELLITDTEDTLFGKPFLRSEIVWAKKYEEHLEGPHADIYFSPTSGIYNCDCSNCLYRDAPYPYNQERECQKVNRSPQKFFGFTGPAKKVFMPPVVYGKNLGHFCPEWLSPSAD